MLKSTKDAVVAVCRADPSLSAQMINAAINALQGKAADCYVDVAPMDRVIPRVVAARILGVTPRTVSLYAKSGKIRPVCMGEKGMRAAGYSEASIRACVEGTRAAGYSAEGIEA